MILIPRNLSRGRQRARSCQRRFAVREGVERAIDCVAGELGAEIDLFDSNGSRMWLPHWVPSQPLAVRAATSDLLTMLSCDALTPPALVRSAAKDFQEAVHLADGEARQEKVLLDFSE